MRRFTLAVVAVAIAFAGVPALAQDTPETPDTMVEAYGSLADTIIAVLDLEEAYVRALLEGHLHAAKAAMAKGDYEAAAAHMSLFANEGDNEIAGIRKRLLDAGHHHHAEEEMAGVYEPGYVVVTSEAKQELLAAAAAMRQAMDDEARQAAWKDFKSTAHDLLHPDMSDEPEM